MDTDIAVAGPFAQVRRAFSSLVMPRAKRFPLVPLNVSLPDPPTADQILLVARVRALESRLRLRNPRRQAEIVALLQGAVDAGRLDVDKGGVALKQASDAFTRGLQTVNRGMFALGAAAGAVLALLLSALVVYLAQSHWQPLDHLSQPDTLASLCFYTVVGSLTSIMTRLTKMDLGDEDSRLFVGFSAMIQPLIALGFMSVMYVIVEFHMFGIYISSENPEAATWVVAFLCGFSERFAPSLLDGLAGKVKFDDKAA